MTEEDHDWNEPIPVTLVFVWECKRCRYVTSGLADPNLQTRRPDGYSCSLRVVRQVMES